MATDALRVVGSRDVPGRLAACVAAIMAACAVITRGTGDIDLAVIKRGRNPSCRRVAGIATIAAYGDMFGRHTLGTNAVMAISTFFGADLGRGVGKRGRSPA